MYKYCILYKYCKNICEQNLNIFLTNFQHYKSVIKYFKNYSRNIEHTYFRYSYNKYSVKISKTNCKLKRYGIFSLKIQDTERITFKFI